MATQVSRIESARVIVPSLHYTVTTPVKEKFNIADVIKCYPVAFKSALEKIAEHFPELLQEIRETLGEKIQIQLCVDLPVDDDLVHISELESRNIPTEGLRPDRYGYLFAVGLKKVGIMVGPAIAPASWNFEEKVISISYESYCKFGREFWEDLICEDLLFEMQNACASHEFDALYNATSSLSKDKYVAEFEEIERKTTQKTVERLEFLTEKRAFNPQVNFYKNTYHSSKELHFLHQQASGHTSAIAERYDDRFGKATPYKGTWPVSLSNEKARTTLFEILNDHLSVLVQRKEPSVLKTRIAAVKAQSGQPWAKQVLTNLQYFAGKYKAYVEKEQPSNVVLIQV